MKPKKPQDCTLIITTFNRPDALELVLESAARQKRLPDELVVADDGSTEETAHLIDKLNSSFPLKIKHYYQENKGFRAAKVRNGAFAMSRAEYIIFIDGDILLHPHFILDHLKMAQASTFLQGSRVLLNEQLTADILSRKRLRVDFWTPGAKNRFNALSLPALSPLFCSISNSLKGGRSCNFSLWRSDFECVNGFNERFEGWGLEDSELIVRLFNKGIRRKNIKLGAVGWHLFHSVSENQKDVRSTPNWKLLQETQKNRAAWCEYGLVHQLAPDASS